MIFRLNSQNILLLEMVSTTTTFSSWIILNQSSSIKKLLKFTNRVCFFFIFCTFEYKFSVFQKINLNIYGSNDDISLFTVIQFLIHCLFIIVRTICLEEIVSLFIIFILTQSFTPYFIQQYLKRIHKRKNMNKTRFTYFRNLKSLSRALE